MRFDLAIAGAPFAGSNDLAVPVHMGTRASARASPKNNRPCTLRRHDATKAGRDAASCMSGAPPHARQRENEFSTITTRLYQGKLFLSHSSRMDIA